jgi:hypothetical protein
MMQHCVSVSYVLQHYNIARSMHVVLTYVAGRQLAV